MHNIFHKYKFILDCYKILNYNYQICQNIAMQANAKITSKQLEL